MTSERTGNAWPRPARARIPSIPRASGALRRALGPGAQGTATLGARVLAAAALAAAVLLAGALAAPLALGASALRWSAPSPIDGQGLTAISCPSESLCVAVDGAGHALSTLDPTAPAPSWSPAAIDPGQSLNSVSCASPTLCVAVDGRDRRRPVDHRRRLPGGFVVRGRRWFGQGARERQPGLTGSAVEQLRNRRAGQWAAVCLVLEPVVMRGRGRRRRGVRLGTSRRRRLARPRSRRGAGAGRRIVRAGRGVRGGRRRRRCACQREPVLVGRDVELDPDGRRRASGSRLVRLLGAVRGGR